MKRKKLLTLFGSICLVLILAVLPFMAACAKPAPPSEEVVPPPEEVVPPPEEVSKEPIRLGFLTRLSGFVSFWGIDCANGLDLAFEELGDEVAGRKIEIYKEDTESNPAVGLSKAQRLVMERGVCIIMGFGETSVARSVYPYTEEEDVLMLISDCADDDELAKTKGTGLFRISHCSNAFGSVESDFCYNQGYRRASILSLDMKAGHEVSAAFARNFTRLGGEIIQETYAPMDTADWSSYIVAIDRTADLLYGFNYLPTFLTQYAEYGLKGVIPTQVLASVDDATLGWMSEAEAEAAVGNHAIYQYSPWIDTPINKKFVDNFYAKYEYLPGGSAHGGYAGLYMVYEAIKAINGNVEDRDAFRQALLNVEIDAPIGHMKFDDYGMVAQNYYILEVEKRQWKQHNYLNKIAATYEMIDQFWPYTAEEYLAMPKLHEFKGTLVGRTDFSKL